uniref:Coiled-coil domain-containing protein 86 n=1 Tax=Rhabditophanes sp. KR3021 TaxID=114890 RepID=A0AC35TPT2_9BILA
MVKVSTVIGADIPKGQPQSGRWWKTESTKFSKIKKNKAAKKAWDRKAEEKTKMQATKMRQQQIRDQDAEEKRVAKERRLENVKRREENTKKNEIVQVINNTEKLRRMKKKDLRKLVKRDTN